MVRYDPVTSKDSKKTEDKKADPQFYEMIKEFLDEEASAYRNLSITKEVPEQEDPGNKTSRPTIASSSCES